jgi:hypothetical protein
VEDADNAQLVAAYKILDDDIMVFRYPEFGPIYSSVEAWRNAVDFARDNNATKLLFDMIGNPGGDIDTQYFMRLALYPLMPYDDWKDDYTQRVSPKMLKIINYIAQGSAVISLLAEYSEEVMAALEERTVSVDGLLGSIQSILQTIDAFRAATGFLIGTEGQIVGALLSDAQDRFEQIANGTKPFTTDAIIQFLSTPDGIITSQIGKYGTQQLFQGGSNASTTGFFNLMSTPQDILVASKKVVYDLPFESYVLLSNGIAGSSASTFEQGVRAYAKKYASLEEETDSSMRSIRPFQACLPPIRLPASSTRPALFRRRAAGPSWRGTSTDSARTSSSPSPTCRSCRTRRHHTRTTSCTRMPSPPRRTSFPWSC